LLTDADLRKHALELLEQSKKFFAEDRNLDPTAFIITADDQLLRPIELGDESAKSESCAKIMKEAHEQHAFAIITVFLARSKDFDDKEFQEDSYSWGNIQGEESERCILLTLSGPGIRNWAVAAPFALKGQKVTFQKQIEYAEGVDLGLFPGWSDQTTSPRAS
jgi:hypothetical protein